MLGAAILSNINPAFLEYSRRIWGFLSLFWGAAPGLVCSTADGRLHGLSCPFSADKWTLWGQLRDTVRPSATTSPHWSTAPEGSEE